jgi:hypothetical protein
VRNGSTQELFIIKFAVIADRLYIIEYAEDWQTERDYIRRTKSRGFVEPAKFKVAK